MLHLLGWILSGSHPTSFLNEGIIEDLEVSRITCSPAYYPSISSTINELSDSIKEKGLLHAITVRTKEGHYEIVAGNRRYHACKMLGWRKIPCHIMELDDRDAFEISLIENIQRRTINSIEEAHAFRSYISDLGWGGVSELATRIGKSTSYVDRRLRLLTLPETVLQKVRDSLLSISVAEELIPINNSNRQSELANVVCKKRMSIKKVRQLIKESEDSVYSYNDTNLLSPSEDISCLDRKARKSFDKSIITFRLAMNRLTDIIHYAEDNWILHDILLDHRNVLHTRIDLLIKQKKKLYSPSYKNKHKELLSYFFSLVLLS
jgi:ParB family chromosome partitioning protein